MDNLFPQAGRAGRGMMAGPVRQIRLEQSRAVLDRRGDGVIYMRSPVVLPGYPSRVTDRLRHWAERAPHRTFIAERDESGGWRSLSYAEVLDKVRRIARALLARPLSAERPVVILSGNGTEHALLGLGAMYAGIPYAPVSPAYSLMSSDFSKLRHIFALLTPGLVFAADGAAYAKAIKAVLPPDSGIELVLAGDDDCGLDATHFSRLAEQPAGEEVDAANRLIGPGDIAKFLFTSGSTGVPKAVINTHRMMCANQEMLRNQLLFLQDGPPVLVDWLPWNHTAGGNNDFGLVLHNGGTFHIDAGKPTPAGIETTVANLRDVSPTMFFNVPKGYEALIPHLRRDPGLCRSFFGRLQAMHYAGAGLSQAVWDALRDLAIATVGESIVMLTGLGCTESAPSALSSGGDAPRAGVVGLPLPGVELKLVPTGERYEARLRGPNMTPGYWRQDELTRAAFDEEGYYRLGDALRFLEPSNPEAGLVFDGRIAEDFKLATGTWVSVGQVRLGVINRFAPYVSDVVVAGHDRDDLAVLVFPDPAHCRELAPDLPPSPSLAEIAGHPAVRERFARLLSDMAGQATGSSNRVERLVIASEPPSLDAHEVTDKGSLNQRAVLAHRAALVADLYAEPPSPHVITVKQGKPS